MNRCLPAAQLQFLIKIFPHFMVWINLNASPYGEMNRRFPVALPTASPLQPLIDISSLVRVLSAKKASFYANRMVQPKFCGEPVGTSGRFQDSC